MPHLSRGPRIRPQGSPPHPARHIRRAPVRAWQIHPQHVRERFAPDRNHRFRGAIMDTRPPDISIVMPCYDEEAIIGYTVPKLISAFQKMGYRPELVAVDNGSTDGTGAKIAQFVDRGLPVIAQRVHVNRGYGYGVLSGIAVASAPWVCIIPADGQVDAEDVVRLYESVLASDGMVVGKVRRRFRMDGLVRKVISTSYNLFVRMLWPRLNSIDINGTPKILRREVLPAMNL